VQAGRLGEERGLRLRLSFSRIRKRAAYHFIKKNAAKFIKGGKTPVPKFLRCSRRHCIFLRCYWLWEESRTWASCVATGTAQHSPKPPPTHAIMRPGHLRPVMQDLMVCKLRLAVLCKRVVLGQGKRCSTGGQCVLSRDVRRIGWEGMRFGCRVFKSISKRLAKSFSKGKFGYYQRKNISNRLCKWLSKFSSSPSHLFRSLSLDSLPH